MLSCVRAATTTSGEPHPQSPGPSGTVPRPGRILRAFGEVEGRDNMPVLKPLVNTELIPDVVALQHEERLIEFFFELALPLKCQVRRAHDQHPISQPPQLQLMSERRRFIGSLCRLGNEEYEES